MERKLDVIHCELVKDEIDIFMELEVQSCPSQREIIDLEALIEKNETEVNELSENYSQLLENLSGLLEYRSVLEKAEIFFDSTAHSIFFEDSEENRRLNFVAGIIDLEKFYGLERMLWRVGLGNVFVKNTMIDSPFRDAKTVSKAS